MKVRVERNVPRTLYYTGDISLPGSTDHAVYKFAISVFVKPDKSAVSWTLDDIVWNDLPPKGLEQKAEDRINSLIAKIMEDKYE